MILPRRKLRIIDYPWHQAHLYRLHSLPARFWLVEIRKPLWNKYQRPKPRNFRGGVSEGKARAMVRAGKIDLALLHLDQWCDGDSMRALPFRLMKELTRSIPRIIIMHGTPDDSHNRRRMLSLMGDLPVVCNSKKAREEWDAGEERVDRYGLPQFRTIIHGYKVDEFFNHDLSERRVEAVTICSGGYMSSWYHGLPLVRRMMRDVDLHWYGPSGDRRWCRSYTEYRTMLAGSLIYFSPTRRAPMPGARTEAALSGCCVVSVPGNNWEDYVNHGVDGFICDDYEELRSRLRWLTAHPEEAYAIGQRGRERARINFEETRFVQDWMDMLSKIGVGR